MHPTAARVADAAGAPQDMFAVHTKALIDAIPEAHVTDVS